MHLFLTCLSFSCRKSKTKPNGKKAPAEEKKHYMEPEYTKVRVVDFDLKDLVSLPTKEIDLNEWLANNSEFPSKHYSPYECLTCISRLRVFVRLQKYPSVSQEFRKQSHFCVSAKKTTKQSMTFLKRKCENN